MGLRLRWHSVWTSRHRRGRRCRAYRGRESPASLPLPSTTCCTSCAASRRRSPNIRCWESASPSGPSARCARSTRSPAGGPPSTSSPSRGRAVSRSRRWTTGSTSPEAGAVAPPATPSTATVRGPTRWTLLAQPATKPARWVCAPLCVWCTKTSACKVVVCEPRSLVLPFCSVWWYR